MSHKRCGCVDSTIIDREDKEDGHTFKMYCHECKEYWEWEQDD